MIKILFVCMGNICRSPLAAIEAERAFAAADLSQWVQIDSAGTINSHSGRPADGRSIALAADFGLDLGAHRARQVQMSDFDDAELIVAMDQRNIGDLRARAPAHSWGRIRLLMSFADAPQGEVPDPYTGGRAEFEHSFDLIREGVAGLTKHLRHLHNHRSTPPE